MTEPTIIKGRHIPENHGGLFTLTPSPLGTHSCDTCVGVYLPLKTNSRAFCAHINAFIWSKQHECAVRLHTSEEEGEAIKAQILQRLRKNVETMDWTPADVDLEKVVIVCPQPEDCISPQGKDGEWKKRPGFYVIEAFMEFLGNPQGLHCDTEAQGFIASVDGTFKIPKSLNRGKRDAGWLEIGNRERRYEMCIEECADEWKIWTEREN